MNYILFKIAKKVMQIINVFLAWLLGDTQEEVEELRRRIRFNREAGKKFDPKDYL